MIYLAFATVITLVLSIGNARGACSTGCTSCSNSTCTNCGPSYFLSSGNCQRCPPDCKTCDTYDQCTSCQSNMYGLENKCTSICATACLNGECRDDTGYCYGCKPGTYGLQCQQNCSLCKDGLCDLRDCTFGCANGYYEYKPGTDTICQPCISDCKSCSSGTVCNMCDDGFYVYTLSSNGKPFDYCYRCPTENNCKTCKIGQSTSIVCTGCNEGHVLDGDKCIVNDNICFSGCSTECNENRICLGSCVAGWSGEQCSDPCASRCQKCLKNNAGLCIECNYDFYTNTCNEACGSSCTRITGKQTCRIDDGYCLNGCDYEFWGSHCNQSCSNGCVNNGLSRVCDRDIGTCTYGCKAGYDGVSCETITTSKQPGSTESTAQTESRQTSETATPAVIDDGKTDAVTQEDDNSVVIIGAAAGGGGLVLIIIIIIIVVCLVKRRRKPYASYNKDNGAPHAINQSGSEHETADEIANMYAKPMKPVNKPKPEEMEEKQDYIYAQPNKPNKGKKPSKKEIGEPHKLYDNIAIDLEDEVAATMETNVDMLKLENLDEGTTSFIETEVKVPSADTYYNTASLIRSRLQIANLHEYIKMKTDYEKEFEKLPKGLTRTCNEALKPKNVSKNRYNGIYAYDATRVVLHSKNYVNANYIDGHAQSPEYIASLGPTKAVMNKFEVFWEMTWQERTEAIVMLTNLEESGKMKCEQYWPKQGTNQKYGEYKVSCLAENEFSEFVVREFNVARGSETRRVTQYHYTAWPDKTVPDTVASLVEFRDKVEQKERTSTGPVMVHCSAGIGRTGTYIALDILIKEGREENSVDVFGCVAALRGQRAHMVQNLEQYIFLHHCVLYALTCDPHPLSGTAIQQVMSLDKVTSQYQAFMEIQTPTSKDRKSVAVNKSRKENRKGADIPGDDHRVRLKLTKQDYINAVYVNGYLTVDKFIIAQTPLRNTVEDFVSMLYQEECQCIVSLDEEHINEKGIGQYLPPANKVSVFGHFQIACKSSSSTDDVVTRQIIISRTDQPSRQEVTMWHYQFRGWKNSGSVPTSVMSFLNLIVDIEKARKDGRSNQPIVVHCLNGSERSSLFCAVSILLEKLAVEKQLSVLNTICHVRSRRRSAFQNIEHFRFCYDCAKEMIKNSATTDYYNVLKM